MKYTYRSNEPKNRKVLGEILAPSIIDADRQFEAQTGINPEKSPRIGCTVEPEEQNESAARKTARENR